MNLPFLLFLGAFTAFIFQDGPGLWQSWLNYRLKRLELKKLPDKTETSTSPDP